MNTLTEKKPAHSSVHSFCTTQSIEILRNDENILLDNKLEQYLEILNKGNAWSDEGFKSIHHFYHPKTEKGIMGLGGADQVLRYNVLQYRRAIKQGNIKSALFFIGAALHLIQDLCVPHHALGHLLKGHSEYENWIVRHYTSFAVYEKGLYDFSDPMEVLKHNGLKAMEYEEVVGNPNVKNKEESARALLALAQRSSAGFLYLVFQDMEEYKSSKLLTNT